MTDDQNAILSRGMRELVAMTKHVNTFGPMRSKRFPSPLRQAVYGEEVDPSKVLSDLKKHLESAPLRSLETSLVLAELFESNQTGVPELIEDDSAFLDLVFSSKRANGWCFVLGGADQTRRRVRERIETKWQFRFFPVPQPYRPTSVYVLLQRLIRYALVYGRCRGGDPHQIGHFIEDHTPGVLVCLDPLTPLESTLSLAAMKLGVPAVVPTDYPFELGRSIRASTVDDITDAVVGFANIRKLLPHPEIPSFPEYCTQVKPEKTPPATSWWGRTEESFYVLRKAAHVKTGIKVVGDLLSGQKQGRPLGVLVESGAEPLDAVDRDYIQKVIARELWRVQGHEVSMEQGRLIVALAEKTSLRPDRLAEVLRVTLMREFPKITDARVTVFVDAQSVGANVSVAQEERAKRLQEMEALSEETCETFFSCVGCSPFAPDHVCILTPDRVPQCNRPYAQIKTGALYGYDDMSNIHHSSLHRDTNSFLVLEKGECLDPVKGEWAGADQRAKEMTHGRTTRILLHTLEDAPTTGCGCFSLICFKTDSPKPGIGIMHRGWKGCAPDGRTWEDLHYALGGKQTPGMSGCAPGYLRSKKFLQADGGWGSVVWVTRDVSKMAGERCPKDVMIAE